MLKAIETVYNGYRFRSRLEARWAVFFDALGIEYEYEKEGYDLGEAGWYLPDFWLPQVHMWAEVKPGDFSSDEREKCRQLVKQGGGHPCFELIGIPTPQAYWAWNWEGESFPWGDPPGFLLIDYAFSNYHGYIKTEHRFYCCGVEDEYFSEKGPFNDTVMAALTARQARFGSNGRG